MQLLIKKKNCMGEGIIIRDEKGDMLVTLSCKMTRVCHPIVAEKKTLGRTLQLCAELNLHEVLLEGDALKIIQDLKSKDAAWS